MLDVWLKIVALSSPIFRDGKQGKALAKQLRYNKINIQGRRSLNFAN